MSTTGRLRVGVLGVGQAGAKHARAYAQLPDVVLAGVADTNAARAGALASELDTVAFDDEETLLAAGLDALSICLPHHLLYDATLRAIARGCHILLEKPMALEVAHAIDIVDACRRGGLTLMVGFVHRFRPEVMAAWRAIQEGLIGRPVMGLENFCSRGGKHPPAWVWDPNLAGGGVLMYGEIHGVDRLRWLIGSDVAQVYARAQTCYQPVAVEDAAVACLSFASGALGTIFANSTPYEVTPRNWDTEVYGAAGMLRLRVGEYLEISGEKATFRRTFQPIDHFLAEAQEFVAAVRAGRQPLATGADGVQALATVKAMYRSIEQGRPVAVSEVITGPAGTDVAQGGDR